MFNKVDRNRSAYPWTNSNSQSHIRYQIAAADASSVGFTAIVENRDGGRAC